jgi:hypothetical protein
MVKNQRTSSIKRRITRSSWGVVRSGITKACEIDGCIQACFKSWLSTREDRSGRKKTRCKRFNFLISCFRSVLAWVQQIFSTEFQNRASKARRRYASQITHYYVLEYLHLLILRSIPAYNIVQRLNNLFLISVVMNIQSSEAYAEAKKICNQTDLNKAMRTTSWRLSPTVMSSRKTPSNSKPNRLFRLILRMLMSREWM